MTADAAGNVYVADRSSNLVRRIDGKTQPVTMSLLPPMGGCDTRSMPSWLVDSAGHVVVAVDVDEGDAGEASDD